MLPILKIKTTYPSLLNPKAITPSSNEKALIKITNSLSLIIMDSNMLHCNCFRTTNKRTGHPFNNNFRSTGHYSFI